METLLSLIASQHKSSFCQPTWIFENGKVVQLIEMKRHNIWYQNIFADDFREKIESNYKILITDGAK